MTSGAKSFNSWPGDELVAARCAISSRTWPNNYMIKDGNKRVRVEREREKESTMIATTFIR